MTKSQLELAKELLRIFDLQHVLAPSNASQRVELNYPNGTRSFVPSNPYWILMNKTLRDTFPNVIFAAEISRGPVSSISPFDTAPIGSTKRVMTIYGKTTNQKPAQPTRGYPPDREYPPRKDYPRQDFSSGSRRPPGESGKAQGPTGDDEDDPSRFDEFAAWKQLTRPPIAGGFPASFMPMGFGYPPFRGPQFGGGGGGGIGQGIGTILPVKKPKFKLLLGKGTFRSPLSLFGGGQQGWYCPCNYYPPAGRFVTTGFPGFWGGVPAGV
ncbi:hypothetical protein IscW_ISCW001731 [Ixodes scapularis]|uniref:Uncharacterized protein n=1 Tax=Ixodes scapularis TaxID=6945 RepID=B7P4A0_IXOSC|nr:hypothetical protein IscW_ISCW001731 [Ixodes scapularis]|eukprot:XP_002405683.1 hypothetical protein IscW_ISCW001731 [Ixodes scapularis]